MENKNNQITNALQAMGQIYGREISTAAAMMIVQDLSPYADQEILDALSRCRRELKFFPTVADIVSRIQANDGRPGVEEAWSLCPISEAQSAVWTEEARDAFFQAALPLIDDLVAARMAFKECYDKLVAQARAQGKPAKWEVSLGHDKLGRERVLVKAVQQGRISAAQAQRLLPDCSFATTRTQPSLQGPDGDELKKIAEPEKPKLEFIEHKRSEQTIKKLREQLREAEKRMR